MESSKTTVAESNGSDRCWASKGFQTAAVPIRGIELAAKIRKGRLDARYRRELSIEGIRLPSAAAGAVSAHHIFPIYVAPILRDEIIRGLNARGVGVT